MNWKGLVVDRFHDSPHKALVAQILFSVREFMHDTDKHRIEDMTDEEVVALVNTCFGDREKP